MFEEGLKALSGIGVCGYNLAVVRDELPTEIGGILVPDRASRLATAGRVVGVGDRLDDRMSWPVGTKVWFREYSGTQLKIRGASVLLLEIGEVLAREYEGEGLEAMPGSLLVRREEMPEKRGSVWLPAGFRFHTLSATAEVVHVGVGVEGYSAGDRVLLAANAGRAVEVEGVPLQRVFPSQVLLRMPAGAEGENAGGHMLRGVSDAELHEEPEARVEEGDPAGLR